MAAATQTNGRGVKRKHRSAACLACRRDHLKCDNHLPCARCVKKGIECIYTAAKKRGPVKGYKNKLVKEREELRTRIKGQREELAQLQLQVQQLTDTKTTIPRLGISLNISAEVTSYLDAYQTIYAPWQGVYAGQWTAQSLLESLRGANWVADPRTLEMFLLVAIGAHLRGQPRHGIEFCNLSKSVLGCLSQVNHPCIASALALLSSYHFLFGDISVVGYYLALSNDMVPKLDRSSPEVDFIARTTETYCTLLSADFEPNKERTALIFQGLLQTMKKKNVTVTEGFHYLWAAGSLIRQNISSRVFSLDNKGPQYACFTFTEQEYANIVNDLHHLEDFIHYELVGKNARLAVEVARIVLFSLQAIAHFGGNEIQSAKFATEGAWRMLKERWSVFIHFPLIACIFQDCALMAAYTHDTNLFNDVLHGVIAFTELWPLCIEIIKLILMHADRVNLPYDRHAAVERIANRLHVFLPAQVEHEEGKKIKVLPPRLVGGSNRSQAEVNFEVVSPTRITSIEPAPIHTEVVTAAPPNTNMYQYSHREDVNSIV